MEHHHNMGKISLVIWIGSTLFGWISDHIAQINVHELGEHLRAASFFISAIAGIFTSRYYFFEERRKRKNKKTKL